MSETKPIPVRLPQATIDRLDAAAKKIGTNRAALIRFCSEMWLDYFEAHGKAAMPSDWQEIIKGFDGRRAWDRKTEDELEQNVEAARKLLGQALGRDVSRTEFTETALRKKCEEIGIKFSDGGDEDCGDGKHCRRYADDPSAALALNETAEPPIPPPGKPSGDDPAERIVKGIVKRRVKAAQEKTQGKK